MLRLQAAFVVVLAAVLAGPVLAPSSEAAPVLTADAKVKNADTQAKANKRANKQGRAKGQGRGKAPIPGGPQDKTALWWNDESIRKALSLTDEQRKKMQAYLDAYRENVPRDRRPAAFHEALVQGKWKEARADNAKLAELASQSVRMRGDLKVDVFSVMTAEQHKILVDRYPRLIYRPWMRAMSGQR